ncbi:MAG: formyltransferase family protein [Ilumatobacteraceae bacterium]
MTARLVVLVSGNGSNLQAVLDACAAGSLAAEVVGVVSNVESAFGPSALASPGWMPSPFPAATGATHGVRPSARGHRGHVRTRLAVVLAGWMRLLTMAFLGDHPNRVVNLHPPSPASIPAPTPSSAPMPMPVRAGAITPA